LNIRKSACFLISTLATLHASLALAGDDLTVIKLTLDQTMQPKGITDTIVECARSPICKVALDAAAAYVGVDSSVVTSAVALAAQTSAGEENNFSFPIPDGYQYCRAKIETVSVVPASGDIASFMSITGTASSVDVYTWTPRLPVGQGRSWVEADFTIVGVRNELAEQYRARGVCNAKYVRAECRGATGINKGSPACGIITD
jgi:hypothetical protein